MPELDKIVQLSRVLGVSTDALLLDELDCFSSIPPELTGSARPFPVSQGSGTGRAAAFGLMLAGLLCAVLGWREYQALLPVCIGLVLQIAGCVVYEALAGIKDFSKGSVSANILSLALPLTVAQLLYLFGASDATFPYADGYLTIYLCGTVFVMLGLGMNNFINAQGFGSMGMITVLLGAVVNIILDPVFIFALGMGVQGAALATVISQFLSALWAVAFLCGKKALLRLRPSSMRVRWKLVGEICALGLSGFIMSATNSAVQVVCNATLQRWGGDVYVGVMTVLNSVREITTTPVMGITNAAQPVIGFNFGAGEYKHVRSGIQFMSAVCVGYTAAVWLCLFLFPQAFIRLFTSDPALLAAGVPSMHVYFFGFFMMALQFAGQSTNTALGRARQAVFFSLLRKAVIVIPLTLWLPGRFGLGVNGVFLAEPISNFLGGGACFVTMLLTVWPDLKRRERLHASGARG